MLIVIATLVKFAIFPLTFVLVWSTVLTLLERRQSALSQDRIGPTRAHIWTVAGRPLVLGGLFHPVADAIKMFFKENTIPADAEKSIFRVAPMIGFVCSLCILALIPFGPDLSTGWGVIPLQIARVDGGIFWILGIGSVSVFGVALAGWASNSRFALLGGVRATAQLISYEVTLGLTLVGLLVAFGTGELSEMVGAQKGLLLGFLPNWGIFVQPLGAALFFVAAMAETKRTPFDLPEGESEIIGYFVEYSSMGFGLFMLGEFIEITVFSSLFTVMFLGGWHFPWILGENSLSLGFWSIELGPLSHALVGMLVFFFKVMCVSVFHLQVRWTLPRFRYDQMMMLGWKTLLPLSLVNILITAVLVWWDPTLYVLSTMGIGLMLVAVFVVVAGPRKKTSPALHHA